MKISIYTILLLVSIYAKAQDRIAYQREEIAITILKSGHVVVPVTVNDSIKGKFIFDTGGGIELVSTGFFKKIESESTRKGVFTCFKSDGERVDVNTYIVHRMQIGHLIESDVLIGVLPLLDEIGIDGLVSSKYVESIPVTIDYKNQVLTIEDQQSIDEISKTGTIMPIFLQKHGRTGLDIFIDVSLNDRIHILSELDTGHGFYPLWVNAYYKEQIKESNALSDTLRIDKMCIKDANRLTMLHQEITMKNDLIYEGLVGAAFFKDGKLSIDIPNERIIYWE